MPSRVAVRRRRVEEEGNTRACRAGVLFGKSIELETKGNSFDDVQRT